MRRATTPAVCLFLLWCTCTRTLDCHATGDVAAGSGDVESQGSYQFPSSSFNTMFQKLATEMGLANSGDAQDLQSAVEKLFQVTPETDAPRDKSVPQIHKGLLKKMLAAKMERQHSGSGFDMAAFMQELGMAMKDLQNFKPEKTMTPTDALRQLAELTRTWISPDGSSSLHKSMEQAAQLLREFLPALTPDHVTSDEL